MRIAFDCKGTLLSESNNSRKLLEDLYKKGHEIIIWSSSYSYTKKARSLFPEDWKIELTRKINKHDYYPGFFEDNPDMVMDLAIDDEDQPWLSTRKILNVKDIPSNLTDYQKLINNPVSS